MCKRQKRRRIMKTKYKVILVTAAIVIVFIWGLFHCIVLNLTPLPRGIKELRFKEVVFLYGGGLCPDCPPGRFLLSLNKNEKPGILIVVPASFSKTDITNMQNVFMLKNKIIQGDEETLSYVKKIAACKKLDTWEKNFIVKITDKGKPGEIRLL
jgi:hypothetical protein